jgi:hypothetical protein
VYFHGGSLASRATQSRKAGDVKRDDDEERDSHDIPFERDVNFGVPDILQGKQSRKDRHG